VELTEAAPAITVLTPIYNNSPYMVQGIESILRQTYSNFEYVLVDDGSTDNSLEILREFERKDGRIRILSRPNTGYIGALNDGLALARASLIARMDADDVATPDRFEKQVRYLADHPECVAVGGRVLLIDSDGDPITEMCAERTHDEIDAAHLTEERGAFAHPALMIRREALRAIGDYRSEFPWAEDRDLFLRLAEVGRLANLPEVVLHYRQHLESIGYARAELQHASIAAAVRAARERRGLTMPERLNGRASFQQSVADAHRKWAWWALQARNVRTARKHAAAALRMQPFSVKSWRAMYCAWRGH
jgi:glycosyltransferase involved in cell wall biosynthesis